ncbi:MAG: hypothetical protein LJE96_05160 [Deltaproteobacteria bacterium]|nr:hypothetical protein [Deltaproteobacteria bacterium]
MPRPKAKKIIVQFDDGTEKEAAYEDLTLQAQRELSRQPLLFDFIPECGEMKYVLLEWKDGYKEVKAVDGTCTDINRYYVITRPEDVGRLSLNKADGYPELLEIIRTPLDLKQINFIETHEISLDKSDREGKKIDHFFSFHSKGEALSTVVNEFRNAAKGEGIDLDALPSEDPDKRRDVFAQIAGRMGIKAFERQQDVLDFMDHLAKHALQNA